MELAMSRELDRSSDHLLPILRMLSEPPSSAGQFAHFMETVSKSLMPLGPLDGVRSDVGLIVMGAAARHIVDASLFRSMAKMLMKDHGVDPESRSPGVESPVECAIRSGNVSAVRFFMGSSMPAMKKAIDSPATSRCAKDMAFFLGLACQLTDTPSEDAAPMDGKRLEILEVLSTGCAGIDPVALQEATAGLMHDVCAKETNAIHGDDPFAVVRLLLRAGVLADHPDEATGQRPLHHAAHRNHWKTAIELVNAGADIDARNARGETPYDWAESRGPVSSELRAIFRSAKMNNLIFGKKVAKTDRKPN
jgi:hypothetical protein